MTTPPSISTQPTHRSHLNMSPVVKTPTQKHFHSYFRPFRTSHDLNQVHGDFPQTPKSENVFRTIYTNINGIPYATLEPTSHHICDCAINYQIDHIGLVETNFITLRQSTPYGHI